MSSTDKDSVLVTGGAGFIGANVCRTLVQEGYHPIAFDSFTTYTDPLNNDYQENLKKRFAGIEEDVTIIRGDTREKSYLRKTIVEHEPRMIIHLAALSIASVSNQYSEESVSTTVGGAINVLEVVREVGFVDRFTYVSSSMVYGDFEYRPADERHPKRPKEVYGGCKYAGEVMTRSFSRRFDIPHTIVRPSAVYGPADSNRRVVQIFVENALSGDPLRVEGPETRLDFTFVEDAARGIVLASTHPESQNETYNITRGEGRTLQELVDIIGEYFNQLDVKYEESGGFRPKRGALDISKARDELGFAPEYSLEKGIDKYLKSKRGE